MKNSAKCGIVAVLIFMAIAIVFICWCVGTWDDNAGYEEFPAETWEAPAVREEGLKVQAVVPAEDEPAEEPKETDCHVAALLAMTEETEVSQVKASAPTAQTAADGTYYDAIPLSAELQAVLFECCAKFGIRPELALALIQTESQFDPDAVNPWSGCYGLCQLNPACFPPGLSPADNIRHGMEYLGRQLRVYGSEAAGLTAYTVGHDNGTRGYANVVLGRAPAWEALIG